MANRILINTPRQQRGSVLLTMAVVLFLGAAAITGWVGWRMVRQTGSWGVAISAWRGERVPVNESPVAAGPDVLNPEFSVAPGVDVSQVELEKRLLAPMRAYYATRTERLGDITVELAEGKHSLRVSFELESSGTTTPHVFFYDPVETDNGQEYPMWEPSLLDVTE